MEHGSYEPISQYKPLSEDEVKDIAVRFTRGELFGSWQVPAHDASLLDMIFMPLMFISEIMRKEMIRDGITHCYGEYKDAMRSGVNGYAMFTSIRQLNQGDTTRIIDKIIAIENALKAI